MTTTTTAAGSTISPSAAPNDGNTLGQDASVIGLVGLAHTCSHFSHMLLSPLFPLFIREFHLTYLQLGMLTSVFFVVSGIGQALSGFLVDRIGARPVLFTSMGLFILSALTAASATGYPWLVAAAMLAGLGNAPFHPVDFTILNQRVSSKRLGYAFSVHGLCGNLGWAVAMGVFVGISSLSNWRNAYITAAVLLACVTVLLFVKRDLIKTDVVKRREAGAPNNDLAFMKLPVVWWCFAFFLLSTMTLSVIQAFSSSILKAVYNVSFEAASWTITAYMLAGAVGMVVGGIVATKWPNRSDAVVATCMLAGAVCLGLCATGLMGAPITMVVLAATGFAVGVGGPSRDMMIKRATPKGATGRVYGTVYSGLDVGFALSPALFGVFMDRGFYAATLAGAALTLLLSVFAAIGVGKRTRASAAPRPAYG